MKLTSIAAGLALSSVAFVALLGAEPTRDEICSPGYSRHHRMPYAESAPLKRQMLNEAERKAKSNGYDFYCAKNTNPLTSCSVSDFELDHIVPLCLGGSNNSSNLQLQTWDKARAKDELEAKACRMVCAGEVSLDVARSWFHAD